MAPNSTCVICIPNVGHWSVVLQLLKGQFDDSEDGLLDKTHLRFFTLETAIDMLGQASNSLKRLLSTRTQLDVLNGQVNLTTATATATPNNVNEFFLIHLKCFRSHLQAL